MTIERHDIGPRMSKVVVHGDTVYLAGIVADNPKGRNVTEQTKDIVAQIDRFLAKAGTDKTKLLSANIWITDMANFAEMNAVWDAWVARAIRRSAADPSASPDARRSSRCRLPALAPARQCGGLSRPFRPVTPRRRRAPAPDDASWHRPAELRAKPDRAQSALKTPPAAPRARL